MEKCTFNIFEVLELAIDVIGEEGMQKHFPRPGESIRYITQSMINGECNLSTLKKEGVIQTN